MSDTRSRLLKVLVFISETDEEHPITAPQIVEELKQFGIEAERKAICKDINFLIDNGYDIKLSDDNKKGYYMADRDFEDWELKILIDAVWSCKFLSLENSKKLAQKLRSLTSKSSQKMLSAATPVESKLKANNPSTKINIDEVLKAIKANRKIQFQYLFTDSNLKTQPRKDGAMYIVSPYALIWQNEHYYLIGNYDKYNDLSYYRLDRMKSLTICDEPRKSAEKVVGDNPDLKIEEYVRSSLYLYDGNKIKLTMQVKSYMVDDLSDYFGTDLHFDAVGDEYQVTVDVIDGEGLYYWLLQYETNVKVISPLSVRDKLIEKAKGIINIYN